MTLSRNIALGVITFYFVAMLCAPTRADLTSADSAAFAVNTQSSQSLPSFGDSAAFNLNTSLAFTAPAFADSTSASLDTRRINRTCGDSESFSLNASQAPTLNSATPQCDGITPGIMLFWTTAPYATNYDIFRNNVLIFTTQTAGTTFWNVGGLSAGQSYTYRIRARFGTETSALSNSVSAAAPICATPPPEVQPPTGQNVPTITVTLDHLWQWDDNAHHFVQPQNNQVNISPTQPTYLLAHGWDAALDGQMIGVACNGPTFAMSSIGCAIRQAKGPNVNLLAWDWKAEANPNQYCDVPDRFTKNILLLLDNPGLAAAIFGEIVLLDAQRSATNAASQGNLLGKALVDQIAQHGPLGSELHLIGHSHGAGVLGVAAQILYQRGYPPNSLTALDTPKVGCLSVVGCLVNSLKYIDPNSVAPNGHVAVFYYADRLRAGVGAAYPGSFPNLTNVHLNSDIALPPDHTWIHGPDDDAACPYTTTNGWYNQAIWNPANSGPQSLSFNGGSVQSVLSFSDLPAGCYTESTTPYQFTGGTCPQVLERDASQESETPGLTLLAYETFDDASSWSGTNAQVVIGADPADATNRTILIDEQGDSSFFRDIAWPTKALEITFDYMFREPRGEESLTVYLNDEIIYYDNSETSLATGQLKSSGAIYVGQAAGTTARLTFVLRTEGTPGGSLVLDYLRTWGIIPGDMNGDGNLDGLDIQPFVNAMLANSTDPGDLYIADFDASGGIDLADLEPFVMALLN